jgi:hypothetical protein
MQCAEMRWTFEFVGFWDFGPARTARMPGAFPRPGMAWNPGVGSGVRFGFSIFRFFDFSDFGAMYSHRRALKRLGIKKLRLTFLGFVAVTSNMSN